jgi:type IV secretory pathway VirB10-like protein
MAEPGFDEGEVWGDERPPAPWWPMLATIGGVLGLAGFGAWLFLGDAESNVPQEKAEWNLDVPAWKGIQATPARAAVPEQDMLKDFLAQYHKDMAEARARDAQLKQELEALRQQKAPATAAAKPEKRVHRQMGHLTFELPKEVSKAPPRFALAPGDTIMPCRVLSAMHSDIESNATVKVTTNIYDTDSRRQLLIPQGSTILVRYFSAQLVPGNERLPSNSTILTLPKGTPVELDGEPLMDAIGQAGLVTDINRHYLRALAAVIVQGVGRGSITAVSGTNPYAAGIASSAGGALNQKAQKWIDLRPTITVAAGEDCNAILTRAIQLPAYEERG